MNAKEIGKMLTELRGEKTIKEVAADLGVSVSAIAMYENGHRVPRDEIKIKIARYYCKSVQEIFFDSKCARIVHNNKKEGT